VLTGGVGSLALVDGELEGGDGAVRSAVEWAQVRAMAADGVSQREIARRLGINRRTVRRLVEADEPPRYVRAAAGSMLDPLEPVIQRLMKECPGIRAPRVTESLRDEYGYVGSVDLVRRRMAALRPPSGPRAAQRTGYRPGQVMQVDWAEMPTRPRVAGRKRRVYALICSLPFSGASTAHFSFDMTSEAFLEGHVRAFEWLGGVPRECVHKTLEDFDFTAQPGAEKPLILHLAQPPGSPSTPTSASSARPAPARRTWPSPCRSRPARPATAWRSPPPNNGSTASRPPSTATPSTMSSNASSATR
jgi:hypothetical protein